VYEFAFELAWKTMKDYLNFKGVEGKFPREVIKEAFRYAIITDGEEWLDMLEKRNLMSHTYDEEKAELAYRLIVDQYFNTLRTLYVSLKKEV
jgi:nucleotidyltransferase substrate binding protein (TIGR01987 family)